MFKNYAVVLTGSRVCLIKGHRVLTLELRLFLIYFSFRLLKKKVAYSQTCLAHVGKGNTHRER